MTRKQWLALLEALTIVHHKLKLPKDELQKMKSNPEYQLSENKIQGIKKIYNDSWYRNKIDNEWNRIIDKRDTDEYTKAMNAKFKEQQSQPINVTVNVDTSKYHDFLVNDEPTKETSTIGFKTKSTLTKPHNRYKLDTSPEARAKRFDEIFGDI